MSIFDELGDFVFGDNSVDTGGIEQGLTDSARESEQILNDHLNRALEHIATGESEAAGAILEGLGMSIEEREKWFDIARDALQPVIDFGESYMPDARQFMDYAKEIVFNPDAIYGTEAWQSYKGQIMESLTNSAAAKSGLLSGNYLQDMSERIGSQALAFRNSEINNALSGFNSAMVPVGYGLNAQTRVGDFANAAGSDISNSILSAYTNLGEIFGNAGIASGNAVLGTGQQLAGLNTDLASQLGNINLANQLGERNANAQRTNSLFEIGGSILGGFLGGGSGGSFLNWLGDSGGSANGVTSFGPNDLSYNMGSSFNPEFFRRSTY